MTQMPYYTIGEAAAAVGLSAKMIRNYESMGLIGHVRSASNYRLYNTQHLAELRFIAQARQLDFSLKQIGELMSLWRNTERTSATVKSLALAHKQAIETRIANLQSLQRQLDGLIGACKGDADPHCPILAGLASGTDPHTHTTQCAV